VKTKLKLAQALPLSEKIRDALSPACERIEIAGSIRRRKPTVGDIEIVAIPKLCSALEAQLSLFGEPPKMVSALDLLLDNLVRSKDNFHRGDKDGDLYQNFLIEIDEESEIGLDLFLTTPDQWGYIYALRTGPGDFNRAWVTQKSKGGLLPDEYHFEGGWLHKDGQRIPTPDESDIFDLFGGIIPATDRDQWRKYYPSYGKVMVGASDT
jgi:DNA polymerase/3'-5' exonuclease PolX